MTNETNGKDLIDEVGWVVIRLYHIATDGRRGALSN